MLDKVKQFYRKFRWPIWIIAALIVVAFPLIFSQEAVLSIAVRVLIYMILATGLNLSNGYMGLFNTGSAGFMCLGAYTTALLTTRLGLPFFPTLVLSMLLPGVFGALLAYPTRKFAGFYFSITTMGFSEIIRLTALNWVSLTRGSNGIHSIPRPEVFGIVMTSSTHYYYLILVFLVLVLLMVSRVMKSRVGRAWLSIRENSDAARSLGVPITRYKSLNFCVMGMLLGLGGCFMAYYYRYISPEMFQIDNGHQVLAMVNLGGLGTIAGPLFGATIISVSMEMLRFAAEYRMIVYALIVLIMLRVRPQGIIGATNTVMAQKYHAKKTPSKNRRGAKV